MTSQTLLLFLMSTFFVSATPGSNMIYAFQMGLNYGFKKTLWVLFGLSIGLGILLGLALLGLGLIAQYPMILSGIKLLGALYLMYLGFCSWNDDAKLQTNDIKTAPTPKKLFQGGLWVSLSNPKAILFFSAFFPKFIDFKQPLLSQYAVLIVAFFMIETLWQVIYTAGGIKLSHWLNAGNRMLYLNRLCGLIFIGIGAMLLWEMVS